MASATHPITWNIVGLRATPPAAPAAWPQPPASSQAGRPAASATTVGQAVAEQQAATYGRDAQPLIGGTAAQLARPDEARAAVPPPPRWSSVWDVPLLRNSFATLTSGSLLEDRPDTGPSGWPHVLACRRLRYLCARETKEAPACSSCLELVEAICAQLLYWANGTPGALRREAHAAHHALVSLLTGTDPSEVRWWRTQLHLRNPRYCQACPPLPSLPAEVARWIYSFLRPTRRTPVRVRPLHAVDRTQRDIPLLRTVTVRVPGAPARPLRVDLTQDGAALLDHLSVEWATGTAGAVLTAHRGRLLPLTVPLDFLDVRGGAALLVHMPPPGYAAQAGLLQSADGPESCASGREGETDTPTVTAMMRNAWRLAWTPSPRPEQPYGEKVRIVLYRPGHKPLVMPLSPATTLDDIGHILRTHGYPLPPNAEVWAGQRRMERGSPLLAQRVCPGMALSVRMSLPGGARPAGAPSPDAKPGTPWRAGHPMSSGPSPLRGGSSMPPPAPSAAEILLRPSNTDWCPLREAPPGERRNLLLVPTSVLVRGDDGWRITARCAFANTVFEVVVRAPFGVPPHMAGSLQDTCLACRSAFKESDTLVVVPALGSVASIRAAPLLHAVCPQLFPAMPPLSSDIRRHLCVFAGVGGSASGCEAAAPGALCTAVDSDPAVLQVFKARLPHATTICAALEDLAWWPQAAGQGFDTLTASPPCPPFSRAGFQRGAADTRAAVWPVLFLLIQLLMPVRILVENVAGIASTEGRPFVALLIARLESYGYVVATQVHEAGELLPTTRKRWFLMAILRSRAVATALASLVRQPPAIRLFSSAACLWPDMQTEATWQAEWTPAEAAVYTDPARKPKGIHPRILAPGDRLPAVMRLYGTAPSVARTAMSSDVVLGFGIRAVLGGRHTVRHVTAPELAAAMGFHDWHTAAWTSHGGCGPICRQKPRGRQNGPQQRQPFTQTPPANPRASTPGSWRQEIGCPP